ncbi:ABC-2 family transporter OS=Ureibacillus acetophenoni OX=614649 GN=SAMN05877842_101530 PE=4 SV=1 [Ureibacillus acetophenoni]
MAVRALLMKDFLMLTKQIKWMIGIFAVFILISLITDMGAVLVIFALIFASLQLSMPSFDEMSKWDKFVNTLPIDRKTIVQSKFILGLILIIFGMVILTPIVYISSDIINTLTPFEIFQWLVIILSVGLLYISLTIPFYIKFGTDKAKLIIFTIVFIPVFGSSFIQQYFQNIDMNQLKNFINYVPIGAFIILLISYILSVKWYGQKQF